MNYETKQDVFNRLLKEHCKTILDLNPASAETDVKQIVENVFRDRYAAALPDDLPVVSKDVSNSMRTYRFLWWKEFLDKAYDNELSGYEDINYKVRSESAEVARALILGVWRVDGTGEIVKLEAEK